MRNSASTGRRQAQARELAALEEQIRLGLATEATKALLLQVHAAELLKASVDALTTSVRNAPSGFKIARYINEFAAARTSPFVAPPTVLPYNPIAPTSTGPKTTVNIGTVSFKIPDGMKPEQVGPAFMNYLHKVADRTVGPNAPLSDALEYA